MKNAKPAQRTYNLHVAQHLWSYKETRLRASATASTPSTAGRNARIFTKAASYLTAWSRTTTVKLWRESAWRSRISESSQLTDAVQRMCNDFRETAPPLALIGEDADQPTPVFRSRLRSAVTICCLSSLLPQGSGGSHPLFRTISQNLAYFRVVWRLATQKANGLPW
jgi:hypothetical protein